MKDFRIFILGIFSITTLAFLSGCSGMSGESARTMGDTLTKEQHFTLKNLKDESVSLDQVLAQNKAVLIDFWATWCGYCVEAMPDLVQLHKENQSRGFTVLGVNIGESREPVAHFVEKMKIPFPVALDEEATVSQAYGIVGIPTTVLVRSDGKILGEYHSFTNKLKADVEKALSEATGTHV